MQEDLNRLAEINNCKSDENMIMDWGSNTVDVMNQIIFTGAEVAIDEHPSILANSWSIMMTNARLRG